MSPEHELTALNEQYIAGLLNADVRWFQQRLAEDFLCIEADGTVRDKADFLRKVAAGAAFVRYEIVDVRVRQYGDVALVTAAGLFTRFDGGTGTVRYTDAYARIADEWQVVSAQVTRAPALVRQVS